jgi:DNA-binding MarR family transcriptional regulator
MGKRPQAAQKTLVRDAQAAVAVCAGWASRLAARRITNFLEEHMRGAELTLAQFGLMAQIAAAPDDTLGALALRTGLDQSTLSRNLRGLEAAGFVEIAISENDQRRRAIPVWRDAHAALAKRVDPHLALRLGAATERLAAE